MERLKSKAKKGKGSSKKSNPAAERAAKIEAEKRKKAEKLEKKKKKKDKKLSQGPTY